MTPGDVGKTLAPFLPGALPAGTAAVATLAGGAVVGVPSWVLGLVQAFIVAVWASSAMRSHTARTDERLSAIESALRDLDCVRAKRVGGLLGLDPELPPCATPPPRGGGAP